ncbi:hypothetical protein HGA92_04455 [Candidatus Gracilibacteria bacterium]|nr:hypothetical protein [Candidatus Gracilibacteria bacterium]NUJ98514.1 hypothetical protein [Candidatus Gracilibacteria bacterium]
MGEKIVETKTCKHCGANFDITDKDLEFYEKVSPIFPNPGGSFSTMGLKLLENGNIRYLIPVPTLCPHCRQQRRLAWRNERNLYKRKCDFSGKDIISIYSPDKPYKVYDQEIWWSDKWDALDYGKDFDFSKTFFDQFQELLKSVPHISRMATNNIENSDYTNGVSHLKNCYLCFNSDYLEDSYYSYTCVNSKNIIDCYMLTECENCYRCFNCYKSYDLKYSRNSDTCSEGMFLNNCIQCKKCFCCNNLIGKEYYAFNKRYSKEKYEELVTQTMKNFGISEIYEKSSIFSKKFPKKYYWGRNNENFSGDYIYNSKNIKKCYNVDDIENCKNCFYIFNNTKDCQDYDIYGDNSSLVYESVMTGSNIYKSAFNIGNWGDCSDMYYCFLCVNSCKNCFGCVGLKSKEYCILNKQYTKEEYEILVPKIIEYMSSPQPSRAGEGVREWGEFFPSSLSPFGYNETIANDFYPLTRGDVIPVKAGVYENENISSETGLDGEINYIDREGTIYNTLEEVGERPVFKWSNYEAPFPKVEKIIPASKLPENIADIPDDILNWAIECEVTKKLFKITKQELVFYIKNGISIPNKHFDVRYQELLEQRNKFYLYKRYCDKCGKEIQTTYAPERAEVIYCEECYNKEVY